MRFKSTLEMKLEIAVSQKSYMHGLLSQVSAVGLICSRYHYVNLHYATCRCSTTCTRNLSTTAGQHVYINISFDPLECELREGLLQRSWQQIQLCVDLLHLKVQACTFWLKLFCQDICSNHCPLCGFRWGLCHYSVTASWHDGP